MASSKFFIPPTLVKDFKDFLSSLLPGSIYDYEVLHDWYDQFDESYVKQISRALIYPDATKSRYSDTDNNLNIRFAYDDNVDKGDYVILQGTNVIYLLDWLVSPLNNNRASRAVRCNLNVTFTRYQPLIVSKYGILLQEEGTTTIVDNIPANAYRYDGRPLFSAINSTPGIVANALTIMSVQYNDSTKNIRIDDEFIWGNETYTVIDVDRVGLNRQQTRGILKIEARKKSGGLVD